MSPEARPSSVPQSNLLPSLLTEPLQSLKKHFSHMASLACVTPYAQISFSCVFFQCSQPLLILVFVPLAKGGNEMKQSLVLLAKEENEMKLKFPLTREIKYEGIDPVR